MLQLGYSQEVRVLAKTHGKKVECIKIYCLDTDCLYHNSNPYTSIYVEWNRPHLKSETSIITERAANNITSGEVVWTCLIFYKILFSRKTLV